MTKALAFFKRWASPKIQGWHNALQFVVWFIGIAATIGGLWVMYVKIVVPRLARSLMRASPDGGLAQAYGLSGDMFGGLNTLFAGLAFAFVALAAYFQRQTMLAQREELDAAKTQGNMQAFEPLFFQLIELFRELRQDAHVAWSPIRGAGFAGLIYDPEVEKGIRHIAQEANLHFVSGQDSPEARLQAQRLMEQRYSDLYRQNEGALGPMFRTLYHAIRLIADSKLPSETQVRYANIARGLLGGEFLMLLMLNCLSSPGAGMKPFVEHFGLLKHIRHDPNDESDFFVASFFKRSAVFSYEERLSLWGLDGPPKLPT